MTMYKLSKYTHFLSPSNSAGHYVYNAISNGLATLDNRIYELLQPSGDGIGILEGEGTAESAALLNQLRSGHIIVENDFDEIDFRRIKMNLARYSTRGLILTIVPTLGCNLACTYCYEGLTTVRFMSPEVQDSVVRFAKSQLERGGYRSLSVAWYGGEPLLKPELLYMLSRRLLELCEQLNVTYSATIVTN